MKRVIVSLLLIAMMVLSTTTALADDFIVSGNVLSNGWDVTGEWKSAGTASYVMTSGTATHKVITGLDGSFDLKIDSKYGDIRSYTETGVVTKDGTKVAIVFDPTTVSYYAKIGDTLIPIKNSDGSNHDISNPFVDHNAFIKSTDGKTYNFQVDDNNNGVWNTLTASYTVGSVPASLYVYFNNNGADPTFNAAHDAAHIGGYDVPVLYSVDFQSGSYPTPDTSFTADKSSGTTPLTVNFQGSGSNNPTKFAWDFGDGQTGTGATVDHTYTTAGTFDAKLVASNDGGDGTTAKLTITVTDPTPTPTPEAKITVVNPKSGEAPLKVELTGEGTNDPTKFTWDFGDGTTDDSGASVTHQFDKAGSYEVKLTVTNGGGDSIPATTTITVNEPAPQPVLPVAHIDGIEPKSGDAPLTVTFTGSGTNDPTEFAWDFGDGSTASGASVTHTFNTADKYTVKLWAKNDAGTSAPAEAEITVSEKAVEPTPTPSATSQPVVTPPSTAINAVEAHNFFANDYPKIYSPDSTVVYDGKGGYTVSDPRRNTTASPAATAAAAATATPAPAQTTYTIYGQVTGASDGKPISGASVVIGSNLQKTNGNGEYTFADLKAGKYDLAVSADGFAAKTQAVDLASNQQVNFALGKAATGGATMASAANETANLTTDSGLVDAGNVTTTNSTANATATAAKTKSPGFEFVAVLAAVLIVAGALVCLRRKN